jgi:effector-binding domain-containing protein
MSDLQNQSLELDIIHEPIRFQLFGLSSAVENHCYGEVGLRLMNQMWKVVKEAKLPNTGINHWVYLPQDRMFVGVEIRNADKAEIPNDLESCEFELQRYAKHVHVGLYQALPQKWKALRTQLAGQGETVIMPSLEVYGHSCEGADESQAVTTILMQLRAAAR